MLEVRNNQATIKLDEVIGKKLLKIEFEVKDVAPPQDQIEDGVITTIYSAAAAGDFAGYIRFYFEGGIIVEFWPTEDLDLALTRTASIQPASTRINPHQPASTRINPQNPFIP